MKEIKNPIRIDRPNAKIKVFKICEIIQNGDKEWNMLLFRTL
jgi:hypothetical protein